MNCTTCANSEIRVGASATIVSVIPVSWVIECGIRHPGLIRVVYSSSMRSPRNLTAPISMIESFFASRPVVSMSRETIVCVIPVLMTWQCAACTQAAHCHVTRSVSFRRLCTSTHLRVWDQKIVRWHVVRCRAHLEPLLPASLPGTLARSFRTLACYHTLGYHGQGRTEIISEACDCMPYTSW